MTNGQRIALEAIRHASPGAKRAAFRIAAELFAEEEPGLGARPGPVLRGGASDRSVALGATRYHTLDNGSITGCRS